jgi:isopenicillin N synthase-like dioxygenase
MSKPLPTAASFDEVPLIDIGGLRSGVPGAAQKVADAICRASTEVGFFYVVNHGVPQDKIDRAIAAAQAFFALPDETKARVKVNSRHRGFLGMGGAKMYAGAIPDLKESFVWGLELAESDPDVSPERTLLGPNQWPGFMPELGPALYGWYEQALACGNDLLRAFALGLGLPESFFVSRFTKPMARGSVVHYPPQPPVSEKDQFGVGPHTDYGFITILWQDQVGGLEVLNAAKRWVPAPPVPGSFVVNVGDLLARWSNDRFASTPHRVVNRSGRERYSMPVFFDPNWETMVDPRECGLPAGDAPHYPPVIAGEHIRGRFDRAFKYRGKDAEGEQGVAFVPEAAKK